MAACSCGEYLACVWSHSYKEKDCPEFNKKSSAIQLMNAATQTAKPKSCACGEYLGCVWTPHAYQEKDCPELQKKSKRL